jgi:type I restriction enzyme R subunit
MSWPTAALGDLCQINIGRTQIRFINEILDELTSRGVQDPARLYDPPFSDLAPTGPEGLFSEAEVDNICQLLDLVTTRAMAAQAA